MFGVIYRALVNIYFFLCLRLNRILLFGAKPSLVNILCRVTRVSDVLNLRIIFVLCTTNKVGFSFIMAKIKDLRWKPSNFYYFYGSVASARIRVYIMFRFTSEQLSKIICRTRLNAMYNAILCVRIPVCCVPVTMNFALSKNFFKFFFFCFFKTFFFFTPGMYILLRFTYLYIIIH